MPPISDSPRVIFFDQPGGLHHPPNPVAVIQKQARYPVTLYDAVTVGKLFSLVAPQVPQEHLTYLRYENPPESLNVMQHTMVLEGYIRVLEDAVYHLRQSADLRMVMTFSYLQEYVNHVYLSYELKLKDKVDLLTHYRHEHRRLLRDLLTLRVMVRSEKDPGHYFSRLGIQHRVAIKLNAQDIFTYQEVVDDTPQAGQYLLERYAL